MLCIGHSHMACVLLAAQAEDQKLPAIVLKDVIRGHFTGLNTSRVVLDTAPKGMSSATERILEGAGPVFAFIGGVRHISLGLRRHPRPFDFILPEQPDLPIEPGAELIPSAAIYAVLKLQSERYFEVLERIGTVAAGPVYQFEPPPPPTDEWMVNKVNAKLRRGRKTGDLPLRFVRYKLWRANSQVVRDRCAEFGVEFVPSPSGAVDEEGFLRGELVANATHANPAYGALVLEQLGALQ
jgi:hypothetical protein